MIVPMPEIGLEEIVADIQTARRNDERVVLFLGSRAGRLFGNVKLYDILGRRSLRDFESLPSDSAKFSECHTILADSEHFNGKYIYEVLASSLKDTVVEKEDSWLAELLRDGFFDSIVSTEVDDVLERACLDMHKKPEKDFHVYAPPFGATEDGSIKNLLEHDMQFPALIKIFGDLKARRYKTVYDNLHFESEPELVKRLAGLLKAHILLIGYDPLWDRPLEGIFPSEGGYLWYVNEELPPEHSRLFESWQRRGGKWCAGMKPRQKNYQLFVRQLYRTLIRTVDDGRRVTIPLPMDNLSADSILRKDFVPQLPGPLKPPPTLLVKEKRTQIFISYSHRDVAYLKELSEHLSVYKNERIVDFWSDERIKPGEKWREEITKALRETSVAVLLVSRHFLNSKFINEVELPQLLEKDEKNGVTIIPVLISDCLFQDSKLKDFHFINPSPFEGKRSSTKNKMWVEIAKRIREEYQRKAE